MPFNPKSDKELVEEHFARSLGPNWNHDKKSTYAVQPQVEVKNQDENTIQQQNCKQNLCNNIKYLNFI